MARYQAWRRQRRGSGGNVPTDSFSDIAFLLIVFFILTTTMAVSQGLESEMPAGQKSEAKSDVPTVGVYRDGTIEYKKDVVSLEQLKAKLVDLDLPNQKPDNRAIRLEAVDEPAWDIYARVWLAIVKAGGAVVHVEQEGEDE